jgi:hypothetical protein
MRSSFFENFFRAWILGGSLIFGLAPAMGQSAPKTPKEVLGNDSAHLPQESTDAVDQAVESETARKGTARTLQTEKPGSMRDAPLREVEKFKAADKTSAFT